MENGQNHELADKQTVNDENKNEEEEEKEEKTNGDDPIEIELNDNEKHVS